MLPAGSRWCVHDWYTKSAAPAVQRSRQACYSEPQHKHVGCSSTQCWVFIRTGGSHKSTTGTQSRPRLEM